MKSDFEICVNIYPTHKVLKSSCCFIVFAVLILGCNKKSEPAKARISMGSTIQRGAHVIVARNTGLDMATIFDSKTDSTQDGSFEITLQAPMFATIQIGDKYGEVYLSPEDELIIDQHGPEYTKPLVFSGKGAEINNYVSWINSNVEKIKWANGKGIGQLNSDEFLHRLDSLKNTINIFHKHYVDSVEFPQDAISLLEYKNKIKILEVGQEYKFYKLNRSVNEKLSNHRKGLNHLEGTFPSELVNLGEQLPFDTALLTHGYSDYYMLLNFYWHNEIDLPTVEWAETTDNWKIAPLYSNALIKKAAYPEKIREFLIAFNLHYALSSLGITGETDSVFTDFKRTYPKSEYLPVLNKSYSEWLAVAPGKPAPDFEGVTPSGEKISIQDLKGKIVYIDVWATWCGPCVAEIPASRNLQQEFAHEKRIQFLNVSVDSRRDDWEKFVEKKPSWPGIHLLLASEEILVFNRAYKLFGVPRYIIVDQSGNIVNINAPRPSDQSLKKEIRQLLAKSI